MLYFFILFLNIIPNLYAQKKFTSFQVSTIVINSCENFIENEYVNLSYDSSGEINNSFLDNIRIKCTKDTDFNLDIKEEKVNDDIIISNDYQYITDDANSKKELNIKQNLVQLNSNLRFLREIASNNSKAKSFYEVINVVISF